MNKKKMGKVLNEAVSYIVNSSGETVCAICSYHDENDEFEKFAREKSHGKSCGLCRRGGKRACRKGVIRYFASLADVPTAEISDCEISRLDLEKRNKALRQKNRDLERVISEMKSQRKFECEKAYFEGRDEGVRKTKDSERLEVALQVYALMTKEYEGHVPTLVADKIFDVIKPKE